MTDEARLGGVWRGGFTGPHEPCPRQYDAEQFLAWKNEGHDYEHCQLFDLRIAEPVCDCWRAEQALRDRLIAENEKLADEVEAAQRLITQVLNERDSKEQYIQQLLHEIAKLTGTDR